MELKNKFFFKFLFNFFVDLIKELDLKRPIFKKTACYGHFGRNDPDFLWEKVKDLSHEYKKK